MYHTCKIFHVGYLLISSRHTAQCFAVIFAFVVVGVTFTGM